ncbi:MAG: hypothetical protein HC905_04465 [Bacteroidales bacterium]|nr:hypothetical protein [Bacteroidales bacterium]
MMNCSHIKNHILAYIEKTLSQQELDSMKSHIESCDACKVLLNRFSSVYSSMDSVNPEVSPYFYSKTLNRLEKGKEQESWIPLSLLNSLKPVLAGLLLLTVTTFGIFFW